MIIFLVLIISAGAVCASDSFWDDEMMNDNNEILETMQDDASKEIYGAGEASFTDFENEIRDSDNFLMWSGTISSTMKLTKLRELQ